MQEPTQRHRQGSWAAALSADWRIRVHEASKSPEQSVIGGGKDLAWVESTQTASPSQKIMKAPPPPILCRTGLSCAAFWPFWVCLTLMNCREPWDLSRYTALCQRSERGRGERRTVLSSPPSPPSQPQRIIFYLSQRQQPAGTNPLQACGDESTTAINSTQWHAQHRSLWAA